MLQLFIANKNYSSWSLRPWVLMRELGIPFEEELLTFGDAQAWAPLRMLSTNGKVPCLRDGTTVVWDSLAIAEYLAETHPNVWPSDRVARAWARSAAAEMHSSFSALRSHGSMSCGIRVKLRETPPDLARDLDRMRQLWGEGIHRHGGPFLAGPVFTAVDAFFAPVAFRLQTYQLDLGTTANGYAERLRSLPSMLEWYDAALAEAHRDPAHEAEIASAGTIVADFRA